MASDSWARGVEVYKQLNPPKDSGPALPKPFRDMTISHLFGEVWTRPGLELREREMITCTTLAALGREAQLRIHLRGALAVGLSRETLEEMFLHIAHYAGWPAGVAACQALAEVVDQLEAEAAEAGTAGGNGSPA
jgi:4-carboxymuconolactone decarboxylase